MKKQQINLRKLILTKETIAELNSQHQEQLKGGATEINDPNVTGGCGPCNVSVQNCPTLRPSICPTVPVRPGVCCSFGP